MYLELDGNGPLYAQLTRALKAAILAGRVAAGSRLPATRVLAREMELSRNTVLAAYEQLHAEGFLLGKVGSGSYVASIEAARATRPVARVAPATPVARYAKRAREVFDRIIPGRQYKGLRFNLQYGLPLTNPALTSAWRRSLAQASAHAELDYPDPQGLLALRTQVCDYLARRRGIVAAPEDVLIVSGTQQAFFLAATVIIEPGESVVLEDPHYRGARQVFQAHGAKVEVAGVDGDGLITDALPARGTRLVVVTPSHQFPAGAVMSLARRLELLDYAARQRCWIMEDDYDGEFRYDAHPLAAMQSLDRHGRVIYIGSFSKTLFPSLRLGYMVLPPGLRQAFVAAKWFCDRGCPAIEQAALARFMGDGGFERHLRDAAKTLKQRRNAMLAGLRRYAGGAVEVADSHAGMHLVAWLPGVSRAQCEKLITLAAERGLGLYSIHPYFLGRAPREGLLLGYASLPPADIEAAMRVFGACLADLGMARRPGTAAAA
ncbi:PLP-dependent aminotransferase family protein [Tahibacter amnicola]|uniref:PLP-dependent aminotransferase family protein n=1 Tax=Tahibacter amnicola TaxID=2976241 RepID=A0ABY6BDZ9_9GAMM|nr:PLP-dependent aminotransferase family protein [Tahibacter amnicola]UXI67468.1 PLP-dependent aminotransferase family protein [Tahibacter amnicola]